MFSYKGISLKDKDWVKGDGIVKTKENTYICYDNQYDEDLLFTPKNILIPIQKDSLCIGFGRFDKNGKEIFTNDIVKVPKGYSGDNFYLETLAIVKFDEFEFRLENISDEYSIYNIVWQEFNWNELQVVANTIEGLVNI